MLPSAGDIRGKVTSPERPLRVAQIMGKMSAGGVESMVMNYFHAVDKGTLRFDLLVDSDSTVVPVDEVEALGGRVFVIPPYQKPGAYLWALVQLFREEQWPVVHSHLNALSVLPLAAACLAKVPVRIAHSHSSAGAGEGMRNAAKMLLRPLSRVFPTHLVACSEHSAQWLFGRRAVREGRVRIIPSAVDTERFAYDPVLRERVRSELGVDDSLVVGHVGRFMPQKNHAFLVDIMSELVTRQPKTTLLLIGDGPLRPAIEREVEGRGLKHSVRFLGVRDDMPALYQAIDVLCLPSLYEGFGMVLIEAQSAGIPCVASTSVPPDALLADGVRSLPIGSGAAAEWAGEILKARRQRSARDKGTESIAAFDVCRVAGSLERLYLDAATGSGR